MKRSLFLIIVLLIAIKAFAQAEPANYNAAINKFKHYYNGNQIDSIFTMFSPQMKVALPIDKFKPTTQQLKAQYGDLVSAEFVKMGDGLAIYKATFKNDTFFLNLALNTQNKLTGLLLSPYQKTDSQPTAIDPSITESPLLVKTLSGTISGSLVMPIDAKGKIPVVIIIADAGNVDRNGNNPKTDLNANSYKMLAYDLGKNGIASVRYDKRLVGESVSSTKQSQLRLDDYSDDAISVLQQLHDDPRFSDIILLGHGQGALVCMIALFDQPVNAYISIDGASEQADKVLTDMMVKTKPQYQADEFKAILDSLRKGKNTDKVDPSLYWIAGPDKQAFLMSWCRVVPLRGMKKVKIPTLIIQGTTDLDVAVSNGEKLKKAKPDAELLVIKGMNHVLKDAPADEDKNLDTYSKPDLPLSPQLVPGIVAFIQKLKS